MTGHWDSDHKMTQKSWKQNLTTQEAGLSKPKMPNHKGSQRIFTTNQENYLNFESSEPSTVPGSKSIC